MKKNNAILYIIIVILVIGLCVMLIALGSILFHGMGSGVASVSPSPTQPLFSPTLTPEVPNTEVPATLTLIPEVTLPVLPAGKIVFACKITDDEDDEICIMNADGSGYRQVTSNDFENYYPSLSPDGNSVVFSSNMTGIFEIYELDLSTDILTRLTEHLREAYAPEISPDGTLIVFAANYTEASSIWLMNRDGSNVHQIFGDPGQDAVDPTWSPDGGRILFALGKLNEKQLFTMTPEGEDVRLVSDTFRTRGRSDWSADNAIIAAYGGYAPRWEIYFIAPDGSNLRQMTFDGRNLAPSFSPDSQWMVYTSYGGDNTNLDACEIYIMRVDGSQNTRLTENDYCDWQPRWGP
jgi:TolB protein